MRGFSLELLICHGARRYFAFVYFDNDGHMARCFFRYMTTRAMFCLFESRARHLSDTMTPIPRPSSRLRHELLLRCHYAATAVEYVVIRHAGVNIIAAITHITSMMPLANRHAIAMI